MNSNEQCTYSTSIIIILPNKQQQQMVASCEGRIFRHAALNDIIHRALATANVPSQLEPVGVSRTDGKRPDGITSVPWKSGHLIWDATVTDTFAPSYLHLAVREAGAVAAAAEERKKIKYSNLTSCASYYFTPAWQLKLVGLLVLPL